MARPICENGLPSEYNFMSPCNTCLCCYLRRMFEQTKCPQKKLAVLNHSRVANTCSILTESFPLSVCSQQFPGVRQWIHYTPMRYRRPSDARDKPHVCNYPNCGKAFYERHSLLRHQTLKHGRAAIRKGRVIVRYETTNMQPVAPDDKQTADN